ncbi:MAG: helix-turn-helix transcriptional regulator [Desulfovibrionaceae bacterium]|nr:helix-turn-helix transcriptional regulator [Desulfovibrionaceae bacterium]
MNSGDTIPWAEAFPDRRPGHVLAGARYRENMTQKALAARIGCRPGHISEMEHGRRPIGKEMAKRLAAALNTTYKVFL